MVVRLNTERAKEGRRTPNGIAVFINIVQIEGCAKPFVRFVHVLLRIVKVRTKFEVPFRRRHTMEHIGIVDTRFRIQVVFGVEQRREIYAHRFRVTQIFEVNLVQLNFVFLLL